MTLNGCPFTGKLIEKFGPGYDRRGISDDPAFRELDILSTFGVYRSSGKRDERPSCKEKGRFLYAVEDNTVNYIISYAESSNFIVNGSSNWK